MTTTHIKFVKFISSDGKFLNYALDELKSKTHLKGTAISGFLEENFEIESKMHLPYTFKIVRLLEPLIMFNRLMIPNKKYIVGFRFMLRSLIGTNKIWEAYANLLHFKIYDIFGREYYLTDPIFKGKYFSETNYMHYTNNFIKTKQDEYFPDMPSNIKYEIVNGFPSIISDKNMFYDFNMWKKLIESSETMDVVLIFRDHKYGDAFTLYVDKTIWNKIKKLESYKNNRSYIFYIWQLWTLTDAKFVYDVGKSERGEYYD
jgi:hypothetical protein